MNPSYHRPLPLMESVEDALTLAEAEKDSFYLKAFGIQTWLRQLLAQAAAEYRPQKNRRYRVMQTGQAQRGFLQKFGQATGAECQELLENLYRFTEHDGPLPGLLFRSLLPLSIEHECSGDFMEPRAPDPSNRPREAVSLLWQSLARWCDWLDAVVHLQIHAQWNLSPERAAVRSGGYELAAAPTGPSFTGGTGADSSLASGFGPAAGPESDTMGVRHRVSEDLISMTRGYWPFQEVDETVILLWPLVKRHNWTYGDLLGVLRDLLRRPEARPCQGEDVLAAYCASALGLHKIGRAKTNRESRPTGYEIALRLCPPLRPPTPPGEPPWLPQERMKVEG
jgi:hypothetical protein